MNPLDKSPAAKAGIRRGDEIKSFGGISYAEFTGDPERADRIYAKGEIKVEISRGGSVKVLSIKPELICPDL